MFAAGELQQLEQACARCVRISKPADADGLLALGDSIVSKGWHIEIEQAAHQPCRCSAAQNGR